MGHIVKNTLRGLLCSLLLLSLCACGGSGGAEQNSEETQEMQETQDQQETQETQGTQESAAAPAQPETASETIQFQLGASGYAMEVPRSYRNGEVTLDELQSNQIAYYYSPDSDMDFDIYQFLKSDPEKSLEEYLHTAAADFDGTDVNYRQINGVNVGTYKSKEVYDGVEYDVLVALMEEGAEYVEVVFWLDGVTAEQDAADILNTLSYVVTYDLQLGNSPFYLTVPMGYQAGEVTEAEAADDMIGYYYNVSSPLDFDVYQFGKKGYTLEKYAIEEANRYEAERVDYRTINGIDMAFYYSYEESNGEMYQVANYLFEYGNDFIEIAFWLDGQIAVKQSDRILSTLRRTDI